MMVTPTNSLLTFIGVIIMIGLAEPAFAQTIDVNATTPCFLNYTRSYQIWTDCGMDKDWLQASMIGFEYASGGWFSMIFAGTLIMITYIKYHKAIYPIIIGLAFIPFAYFLFPTSWLMWAGLMTALALAIAIYKIYKNHASEFN
jgi:hypothetical protein